MKQWVKYFFFLVVLQYLYTTFRTVRELASYLNEGAEVDVYFFVLWVNLLYIPVIFWLLYKGRRWGWILLFADNIISLILRADDCIEYFRYQEASAADTFSFLWPVVVKIAFAVFLSHKDVMAPFKIDNKTRNRTAIVSIIIAAAYLIWLNVIHS